MTQCLSEKAKGLFPQALWEEGVVGLKRAKITSEQAPRTEGWQENPDDHIRQERQYMIGMSELAFYHTALIIKIRRRIDLDENWKAFQDLWQAEASFLTGPDGLNGRWLVSALDSFADYGSSLVKAQSMAVCACANLVKLIETEYRLQSKAPYVDEGECGQKASACLWAQTRDLLREGITLPWLRDVWERMIIEAESGDTVLARLKKAGEGCAEDVEAFAKQDPAKIVFAEKQRVVLEALVKRDATAAKPSPVRQARVRMLLGLIAMLRLANAEFVARGGGVYKPEAVALNCSGKLPLVWGGRGVFFLPDDDTIGNTLERMERALGPDRRLLVVFYDIVFQAFYDQQTVLDRLKPFHKTGLWLRNEAVRARFIETGALPSARSGKGFGRFLRPRYLK